MKFSKAVLMLIAAVGVASVSDMAMAGSKMDSKPGPAYTMVEGKITKIEGDTYTVQSESTNYQNLSGSVNVSEAKIVVSKDTKKLHGEKKVGDKIRAEVTRGGFANSIQ